MRSCSSAFFCALVSSCQTSTAIRTFQSRWMLYDSTKSKQDQESTHRTVQPSCDLFHRCTMGREEAQYCITCQDRADGDHRQRAHNPQHHRQSKGKTSFGYATCHGEKHCQERQRARHEAGNKTNHYALAMNMRLMAQRTKNQP